MYKIFFVFLLLLAPLWSSDELIECQQQNVLAKYTGHYSNTKLWNDIPKERNWASINKQDNNEIISLDIDERVGINAYTNWHDGTIHPTCSSVVKNKLWVINEYTNKWEGPFLRVGKAFDENAIYFKRLFQNKCYKDELNQKWCFKNSEIKINNKKFKVELMLDIVEIPLYGSAVSLEDNMSKLWMFVPYEKGYKVFQDTAITDENHKEVNPLTDKPWHILK
jgi:hypothetical protein